MGTQKQKTMAKRVASLIGDVAKNGDTRAEASLVEILADESILGIIDDVIELLANSGPTRRAPLTCPCIESLHSYE